LRPRRWCPRAVRRFPLPVDRGSSSTATIPAIPAMMATKRHLLIKTPSRSLNFCFFFPIRLSPHPAVLQKRPRHVQCSRKSACTCLPLPPTVNTSELSKGTSAYSNTRDAENFLTALPVQIIAMAPVNSRRNQSSLPAGMFCLVIPLQASHPLTLDS